MAHIDDYPSGWGRINPNSEHQLWSHWTFRAWSPKHIQMGEVKLAISKWLKMGFGSMGQARITQEVLGSLFLTTIECRIEGPPAHDPGYVESVRLQFSEFVDKGWGSSSFAETAVKILAGDIGDGKPRSQLLVMPTIQLTRTMNEE